ncbi:hypothetical protein [Micromonospora sp. WMMD1155]|uniref:hypothetical protein n=1 Tax=Micromonospora sp. WMMD1155 TaxID=3016094 RepID=UPI00249AEE3F|nr:hypothetical protein [Micromonospora sp. WMMD1155]WFE53619.1 hypothetical protein O7617_26280 [Micromonospora sp. WMMD1155]
MVDLRAGLLATALVVTLAGCSDSTGNDEPTGRATSVSPAPVRTDRDPIVKRFPRLGDFVEAHWQAASAGGGSRSSVPGPTDTRIEALVVLRPDTLATTLKEYEWQPAPPDWDAPLSAELRPFLPNGGTWQVSEQFTKDVRTAQYNGTAYLDAGSGTVFLRVIDS